METNRQRKHRFLLCPALVVSEGGAFCAREKLEEQLQSELKFPRVKCRSDSAEVTGALVHADTSVVGVALELSMVPGVEGLKAKLDAAATGFADDEILEERQIPVVATRTAQRVEPQIPIAICARATRSARWTRKNCRIEPLVDGLRVRDAPRHVRPVSRKTAGKQVRDVAAAHAKVDGR